MHTQSVLFATKTSIHEKNFFEANMEQKKIVQTHLRHVSKKEMMNKKNFTIHSFTRLRFLPTYALSALLAINK
jgi:hypothetical protein